MMYKPKKTFSDTTSSTATFQTKTIPNITRLEKMWQLIICHYNFFHYPSWFVKKINIAEPFRSIQWMSKRGTLNLFNKPSWAICLFTSYQSRPSESRFRRIGDLSTCHQYTQASQSTKCPYGNIKIRDYICLGIKMTVIRSFSFLKQRTLPFPSPKWWMCWEITDRDRNFKFLSFSMPAMNSLFGNGESLKSVLTLRHVYCFNKRKGGRKVRKCCFPFNAKVRNLSTVNLFWFSRCRPPPWSSVALFFAF